jgi:Tfp pilus tip-associated adhesin PilY1
VPKVVTTEDTPLTNLRPLDNDSDPDGDTPKLVSASSSDGTVFVQANNLRFDFTPSPNFIGIATITYVITDGDPGTADASANFYIQYTNVDDDPPAPVDDTATTDEDAPVTIVVLDNDVEFDGQPLGVFGIDTPPSSGGVVVNPDDTITYTPAANSNGTDAFSYSVTDGTTAPVSGTKVTVDVNPVNDAPTVASVPTPVTVDEDQTLSVDLSAVFADVDVPNEGDSITISVVGSDNPSLLPVGDQVTGNLGGTLNAFDGVDLTLQPQPDQNGSAQLTIQAKDAAGASVQTTLNVTVDPVDDPPRPQTDSDATPEDTPIDIAVLANDVEVDGQALTVTAATGASNGTLTVNADNTVNYAPDADFNGTDTFTYTVTDNTTAAVSGTTVTIDVTQVDDAPVANDDDVTVAEDGTVTFDVFADNGFGADSEVDGGTLTVVSIDPASNGTLTSNGGGSYTYTPNANFFGTETLSYVLDDGVGDGTKTDTATVTIDVTQVDDAPVAVDDTGSTPEDTSVDIDVFANDSEVDSTGTNLSPGALTIKGIVQPANGTVTDIGGQLRYTPDADFFGADTFSYTVEDGVNTNGQEASATVTVTVNQVDDPPSVANDSATTAEDTPVDVDVFSNDTEVDSTGDPVSPGDLAFKSFTQPANGTVTDAGGRLRYTPDADFTGTDTFTYTAEDGVNTNGEDATATVTVAVNQVDDPPSVGDDTATTDEDTPVDIDVFANDTEVDSTGDPVSPGDLAFKSFTQAANGTVTDAGGQLRYTPDADFFGTDTFTYTAEDGVNTDGRDATATVTVTVNPVDDAPTATADAATTNEETAVAIDVVANDSQIDGAAGDPLIVTGATNGSNGNTSVGAGGTVTYTPATDFFGTDTFTYTVRDSFGTDSDTAVVTVTVNNVDDPPEANDDAATIDEDTVLSGFDPLGNDAEVDGGTLEITTASVDEGSISFTSTSIDYTPDPNFFGTATIDYTIEDGVGTATDSAQIVVTVTPVNDVPVADDDAVTILEDVGVAGGGVEDEGSVTIPVLDNDYLFDAPVVITIAGTTQTIDGTDFPNSSESTPTTVIGPTGDAQTLPNGTVEVQADGTIVYTPKANYNGTDFFTYTIEDVDGDTATGRVDITITPVNDAPTVPETQTFTVVENDFLDVVASGVLQPAFDPDGDVLTSVLQTAPANGDLTLQADGSFQYAPDVNFVGTDSFTFFVNDGTENNAGDAVTVFIEVTEAPPAPPPPPPGEVEFDFELAQVPLELAVGVEPNVLVIMDDSGSMDWSVLTEEPSGRFTISNHDVVNSGFVQYPYAYAAPVFPNSDGNVNTNTFAPNTVNGLVIPSQQLVDSLRCFDDNTYGIWRIRSPKFNKIYYNPDVRYEPWRGLRPDNTPFPPSEPTAALLDPYQINGPTMDLTTEIDYATFVPETNRNCNNFVGDGGLGFYLNQDYYIARYYTTPEEPPLEHDDPRTLVEIRPDEVPDESTSNPNDTIPPVYAGGPERSDCALDDGDPLTCTYEQEIQNFANWYTYYRSREYTVKSSLGRVVADTTAVRIGYAALNDNNDRVRISEMGSSVRAGNKRDLLDQIYEIDSNGGTPLRDSLDEAGRHFECRSGDSFGSNSNTSPGDAACPIDPAPAGQCQQNFALLFTDGSWSGGNPPSTGNEDGDDSSAFDGGIFADNRTDTLADVAMNYYERDLHPSLDDEVPTTARDRAFADEDLAFTDNGTRTHQHMTTFTVGFGVTGFLDPETDIPGDYTDSVSWPNPFNNERAKIDDLFHAALNGRGDYLSAADSVLLEEQLTAAFDEFGSGTGAASAVAFNSQQLRQDTLVFRGFYNTKENTGDLVAQLIDIDNDTLVEPPEWSAAEALDAKPPGNRVIITWDDVAERGIPFRHPDDVAGDALNSDQTGTLDADMVRYLRGERSNERPLGRNFRERPFTEGLIGDIVNSTPVFVGPPNFILRDALDYPIDGNDLYSAFKTDNADRDGVVYVGANEGMLHAFASEDGEELFAYIPDKLINGTPYANELFQITSPSYGHKFFNDNTPAINDIFFDPDGGTGREWRTVLVGSLRAGGKGLYALDITDPSDFTNETSAADQVLWEFTDNDDTYPTEPDPDDPTSQIPVTDENGDTLLDLQGRPVKDLGYAFSVPTISMTNVPGAGSGTNQVGGGQGGQQFDSPELKWAAVFGNGYNSTYGVAKLFVTFIEDGADGSWDDGDFVKLDTGFGVPASGEQNEGLPNGLGTPRLIDLDSNGTADYAYAGDLLGNLFRFDLTADDPDSWTVTRIFKATYGGTQQPITTQPIVTRNPQAEGVIVVFATGSFITEPDGTSTEIQSLYGIWDRFENNPVTASGDRSLLVEQEITNLFDPDLGALRSISSNTVNYTVSGGDRGWYVDLDAEKPEFETDGTTLNTDQAGNDTGPQFPGERAIRNLQLRGGFVFVNTIIPRDDSSCERSPGGFALAMNPVTGGAGGLNADSAFDLDNDGDFDSDDLLDGSIIGGLRFDDAVPTDSAFIGTKRFTQLSDRTVDIKETNTGFGAKTGRLSWRELE